MATNDILLRVGTPQISFGDHLTDFSGGTTKNALEVGTPTDVQIDCTSVANGAGRESAKFDFGATRAEQYSIMCSIEFATAPVTGEKVNLYLAPSPISTPANGNPQSIDGVDAAAPSGVTTLQELLDACQLIGTATCSADATGTVQTMFAGVFSPTERYGIFIPVNDTSDAFHSDMVETHFVFNPVITEIQ